MLSEADVRAVLAEVIHPTFGMNLLALGMVRSIRISPSGVELDLVMNCSGCPAGEAVLARIREKLSKRVGAGSIKLVLLPEVWVPPCEYSW
jgi:metal-sulfur cluster biosynthetic enzyme